MADVAIILVALTILGFGLISGRVQGTSLTPPMVFTTIGIVAGPIAFGWLDIEYEEGPVHILAELTLILVLFVDAARIDLRLLRRDHDIPVRLLVVGLPLTLILGAGVAALMFQGVLTFWEAAVLAAILAPTDAALGQAVVNSRQVPVRIRQALNVESGLNDGIALPLVLALIAAADAVPSSEAAGHWVGLFALQVTLGPIAGIGVGYLGGRLVERASRTGWMSHSFQQLAVLGLALLAFALAELIGGNGFIAAFAAGLTLGHTSRSVCSCLLEFGEAEGQLLTLLTFMVFGALILPEALEHVSVTVVLYAVLSLTVLRMVPVAISLIGKNLHWPTVLFLGWFGPRGIASVLFSLLLLQNLDVAGGSQIAGAVGVAVLLSILAHGITAAPLARRYGACMAKAPDDMIQEEKKEVGEMPVRHPDPWG